MQATSNDTNSEIQRSIVSELFNHAAPITAEWYSGALIVPDGQGEGYESTYNHYQIFIIRSGQITEHLSLTSEEFERFRDVKYEEYKATAEFEAELLNVMNQYKRFESGKRKKAEHYIRIFRAEQYLAR